MATDLDIEFDLRQNFRRRAGDAPLAHADLAERTRGRYRRARRQRAAVAGVSLAAAMIVVGLPVLVQSLPAPGGGQAAATTNLYDLPARGPLAGNEQWLAGAAALPWESPDIPAPSPAPDAGSQRVAFAGDVAGTRVVLVLGRLGADTMSAWFTGPAGAAPSGMALAASPEQVTSGGVVALVDSTDVTTGEGLLVAVAPPGNALDYSPGIPILATGTGQRTWSPLDTSDGVAATTVPLPGGWPAEPQVRALRDGTVTGTVRPVLSRRILFPKTPVVEPADPRGLRGSVDESLVRLGVDSILGQYGPPFDQLQPVLLAAGRLGDAGTTQVALVGATLPSGATVAWVVTESVDGSGSGGSATATVAAPAGTPLLERVIAVPVPGGLIISGPAAGTSARLLDAHGDLLTTLPLVRGAAAGATPDGAAAVRVRDAEGNVIATAPVTEMAR